MDLKNKVALVTGGADGIGRAICEEFLKNGAKVSVCDINTEAGEKLVQGWKSKYGRERVIFCPCDVTDYPQFEESFEKTLATYQALDIVVNNAGILNDRLWELEVDVNLNGVIRGTMLAFRFMGKDRGGPGGVVVNIGSNVCFKPYVSVPIYTATKHAIIGFTRAYGDPFHVAHSGVRVIGLCPAATDTNLIHHLKKQLLNSEYERAWTYDTANSPSQKPEHVGRALISVLTKAPSGSVWAVEKGEPPYQVNFS